MFIILCTTPPHFEESDFGDMFRIQAELLHGKPENPAMGAAGYD
jgi:hypothetical protein